MGIMTISVDDDKEEAFRKAVAKKFGTEKGAISRGIEFGMDKVIEDVEFETLRRRAIERLEKGFNMGKRLWKTRDDMHDRPELQHFYRQQHPSVRNRSK